MDWGDVGSRGCVWAWGTCRAMQPEGGVFVGLGRGCG